MGAPADALVVKTVFLYNHVSGMEDLKLTMGLPKVPNAVPDQAAAQIINPIIQVLSGYDV